MQARKSSSVGARAGESLNTAPHLLRTHSRLSGKSTLLLTLLRILELQSGSIELDGVDIS